LKVPVLRIKPSLYKFAGITGLALLVLAATSEGAVSRDLVAALAILLSIAAFTAAMLAYRQGRQMQRSAQDYFAKIENAARRLERDRLLTASEPPAAVSKPARRAPAVASSAEPANAPRLAQGLRPTAVDDALLVALDSHALCVSLEPVVELHSSKVSAYRVHAHVTNADGISVHLRRLAGHHPGIDPVKFDMELFHAAAGAVRRFPGASADDTPLICPLGRATLGSPKDLRKIAAMMNNLPSLKSGLVLELPFDALAQDDLPLSGAGLLSDSAIRLCMEGGVESRLLDELQNRFAFEFWSVNGAEVTAEEMRRIASSADSGREVSVIATALAEDHEVVAMIDAGVTLACGPRFSDPKPVRPLSAAASPDRDRMSGLS
jgi:hypothetical protein